MEEDIAYYLDDIEETLELIRESLRSNILEGFEEAQISAIVEDLSDIRLRLERIELDLQ